MNVVVESVLVLDRKKKIKWMNKPGELVQSDAIFDLYVIRVYQGSQKIASFSLDSRELRFYETWGIIEYL